MTIFERLKRNFIPCLVAGIVLGCSNNGSEPSPTDNAKDRQAILTHWVDKIIVPSYANFKVKFDNMIAKAGTFTGAPNTTNLNEFRSAWVDAYIEWQKVELFEFGPADKYTLRNFFNIYPADVLGINASINDPTISLEFPSAYARQGFPALDYLINGVGADDASIVAYYTEATEGAKRKAYINRLLDRMSTLISQVIIDWNGAYRETFITKTGLDIGSSTGLVVNAFVLHYERYIRSGKIGIPSGATIANSGVPYPEKVEAFYKRDISLALAKTAQQAVRNFFNGVSVSTGQEGPSFKTYLNSLEAKDDATGTLLSEIIDNQCEVIEGKLDQLSPNLYQQVQTNNQLMLDTYTEMQKLVRILKVDMTSAMSITITYTDNDGD